MILGPTSIEDKGAKFDKEKLNCAMRPLRFENYTRLSQGGQSYAPVHLQVNQLKEGSCSQEGAVILGKVALFS